MPKEARRAAPFHARSPPVNAVPTPNPAPGKGRVVLWLLALAVPLLLLLAWWPAPPKPRPARPNPNGYDYFLEAVGTVGSVWTNRSYRSLSAEELNRYLAANQPSLDRVREGLKLRSQSYCEYGTNHLSLMFRQWGLFRRIGALQVAEGWLAELEGKPAVAADKYFESMNFGQACSRGGLFTARLVGIAIEAHALDALQPLASRLDAMTARTTLERLTQLDSSHEPFAVNAAAEDDWVKHSVSPWERLMWVLHPTHRKDIRTSRQQIEERVHKLQAARRRAIVVAAARLFELERGRRPTGYADLVPAYLPAEPLDPTTGKPIAHLF